MRAVVAMGLFAGYSCLYATRNSLTAARPRMMAELGLGMADVGFIGSSFAFAYGVSKFFSSAVSDGASSRALLASALLCTAAVNVAASASTSVSTLAALWVANGLFQGLGWPACAQALRAWFPPSTRGTWWAVVSASQNAGSAATPLLVAAAAASTGTWRSGVLAAAADPETANRPRHDPPLGCYVRLATAAHHDRCYSCGADLGHRRGQMNRRHRGPAAVNRHVSAVGGRALERNSVVQTLPANP